MDYGKAIERGFADAPFVAHLGITLEGIGPGWCEARLDVQPWQLQQTSVERGGKRELVAKLNATMAVVRPQDQAAPAPAASPG